MKIDMKVNVIIDKPIPTRLMVNVEYDNRLYEVEYSKYDDDKDCLGYTFIVKCKEIENMNDSKVIGDCALIVDNLMQRILETINNPDDFLEYYIADDSHFEIWPVRIICKMNLNVRRKDGLFEDEETK